MGIEFRYDTKEVIMLHELKEKVYLSADGKRVVDFSKHKGPASLLGGKGQKIPMAQAIALGLAEAEKKEEKPAASERVASKKEKK